MAANSLATTIVVTIHVLSAIILLGGIHHHLVAVLGAARRFDIEQATAFSRAVEARFRMATWVSAFLLLLTGLHLFGVDLKTKLATSHGMSIFALKGSLALLVLGAVVAMSLPMEAFDGLRRRQRLVLRFALIAGFIVAILGVILARTVV